MRRSFAFLLAASAAGRALFACRGDDDDNNGVTSIDAATDTANDSNIDGSGGDNDTSPPVTPKGARILGLDIATDDPAYYDNVQFARDAAAVSSSNVRLAWDEIEREAGDAGDAGDAGANADADAASSTEVFFAGLHVFGLVLTSTNTSAAVTIDVVDQTGSRTPKDLLSTPYDDNTLAIRFDRVIDYALDQLHDVNVTALFIASDLDRTFGSDAAKYTSFAALVAHARTHVHSTYPNVPVGVVCSIGAAVANKNLYVPLWSASDVVGVTYDGTTGSMPMSAFSEIAFTAPPDKPIHIREARYASASNASTGEADQAAFVHNLFGAWDTFASRIRQVTFFELDDAPADVAVARAARAGHPNDSAFIANEGSLGLRATAHRQKPAFVTFANEAHVRGF